MNCTLMMKLCQFNLKLFTKLHTKGVEKMSTQGDRLKKIRQALNLSQEELGKSISVSKQYISNLEASRNLLNNEKLVSLLVDYNVNINYLLAGIGNMFNPPKYEDVKDDILAEVERMLKNRGL